VKLFSRCRNESINEFILSSAAATCAYMNMRVLPISFARRSVGVGEVDLGFEGVFRAFVCDVLGFEVEEAETS
jgi:hypothetical protein